MGDQGRVVIVGAGLVGCLAACYLGRRGYTVDVYERRADPRASSTERGRSINLALSERGLDALRRIGLEETVMAPALPMHGRMMHAVDGTQVFQQYSSDGKSAINSIGRGALNETLLNAADAQDGVTLHFGAKLVSVDAVKGVATFEDSIVEADAIIGADGWASGVRASLVNAGLVSVTEDPLDYGYKELTIPAVDGEFALDPDALHIWPRGGSMMIALPNPDKSFTCTLFWPEQGEGSFAEIATRAQVQEHFEQFYPDAVPLIPDLLDDYMANPIGHLGTIHTSTWHAGGRVALIGDAAHAILPFFGQGANCGFEDVVSLDRCVEQAGGDWAVAFGAYELDRRENAEAIAQMAKENFIEMRDKVGHRVFLLQHKIKHGISRAFPNTYRSRYELVSFSTVPYAEVYRDSRRQSRVLAGVGLGVAAMAGAAAVAGATAVVRKVRR